MWKGQRARKVEIRATAVAVELSCLQKQGLLVRETEDLRYWESMGPGFVVLLGKKCMENMNKEGEVWIVFNKVSGGEGDQSSGMSINVNSRVLVDCESDSGRGSDGRRIPEGGAKRGLVWESGKLWDLERASFVS